MRQLRPLSAAVLPMIPMLNATITGTTMKAAVPAVITAAAAIAAETMAVIKKPPFGEVLAELDFPLFQGIRKEDMQGMLGCTGYHLHRYKKGEGIILEEEQVRHIGIVLEGSVDMVKEDIWGGKTLLMRIGERDLFGESFACGDDIQAVVSFLAAGDTQVMFIPFNRIMHTCTMACEFHHRMVENMVRIIANKNRDLMRKVEIVSKKSLREKIMTYLSVQSQSHHSRYFEIPLGRVELAEYLCADRSALTRELASMKADGLIDFDKNVFRIL